MRTPLSPTPPRGRKRTWQSESVSGSSVRSRRSALDQLSSEIDFAFRASGSNPSGDVVIINNDDHDPARHAPIQTPIQSGDYVIAMQLRVTKSSQPNETVAFRHRVLTDRDRWKEDRLVWDVNDLRQQLQRLRDHKHALETRRVFRSITSRNAVYKDIIAYFKNILPMALSVGLMPHNTRHFCGRSCTATVVTCAQLRGVDALLEQWRRYADYLELRD